MTSTPQRVRLDVSDQKVQTTWSKIFPIKVDSKLKSFQFTKNLVAVAVSNIAYIRDIFPEEAFANIAYIRDIFPEEAFANKSLDKMPLKILKQHSECEDAVIAASWLLGAFEAIEKEYLKELMLVIYLDPSTPDEVHEMYTFKFSYKDGEAACELVWQDGRGRDVCMESIKKSTTTLLRTVLVLTQGLPPLPDSATVSMKLTYYDAVTPQDYEPRGFVPTELVRPRLPAGALSLQCGQVETAHHGLGLQAGAVTRDVAGQEELDGKVRRAEGEVTEAVVEEAMEEEVEEAVEACIEVEEDGGIEVEEENGIEAEVEERGEGAESQVDQGIEAEVEEGDGGVEAELESISLLQQPSVSCSCSNTSLDPLMLLCQSCGQQQHAACYRILQEDGLPDIHYCVACSQEDRPCTDPRLLKMCRKQDVRLVAMTCLYRRLLAALITEVELVNSAWISVRFGLEEEIALKMVEKAESEEVLGKATEEVVGQATEEVVGQATDSFHRVNRGRPLQVSLKKYMGVKHEMMTDVGDTKPSAAADVVLGAGEESGKRRAGEEGRQSKRRKASTVVEGLLI